MNSPHQREQLPDLLSDALSDTERVRVESHLAQCAQCTRELRALQLMQQSLVALPAATPPNRVRANVHAALRENNKQVWTFSSFLANRARSRKSQETDANLRPIQSRERNGVRRPFTLPTRPLAWGGAVAVATVGLMLLARPSLQNDPLSATAPVSETELASRADQSSQAADMGSDAPKESAISPAPKSAKPKNNQKSPPKAKNSQSPAIAPPRAIQPEELAPVAALEMPAIETAPQPALKPQTPRANKKLSRPITPVKKAPKLPVQPAPDTQPLEQAKKNSKDSAPATKQAPILSHTNPPLTQPASSGASLADNGGQGSSRLRTAPSANAPGVDNARNDQQKDSSSERAPLPSANGAFEAAPMARQSLAKASPVWMGGEVTATINRVQAFAGRAKLAPEPEAPILTLSVSKAIGNARLFLRLPNGEVQVWVGSINATPVKIRLDNAALGEANLRSGQKISARLEQIDGEGNPKGSTLFDLLWP